MKSKELTKVGIVGAGTQGPQIAYRCIIGDRETYIYDLLTVKLEEASRKVQRWLDDAIAQGKLTSAETRTALARLHLCETLEECVGGVDIVIEAVPENLALKQSVWDQIDSRAPERTLLTTNSSSLLSSAVGRNVGRKDKTFNINFGMPVEHDEVEVMWNSHTCEETKKATLSFLRSLGFIPLVTFKEIKGFSVNRIWRAIKKEALYLLDQGYSDFQDIDRGFILEFGMSMGPFQLMDVIGLDVVRDIELSYYAESGDEADKPPRLLEEMIARGHLGVKSGRGFYTYPNPEFSRPGWLEKRGKE